MTRIRSTNSSEIDDRRGGGGGGGSSGLGGLGGLGGMLGGGGLRAGGGIVGVIVLLAALILPKVLGGSSTQSAVGGDSSQSAEQANGTCSSDLEQIVCGGTNDVQAFWKTELPQAFNTQYQLATTTFFSGATNTGCGQASAQTGPFYCPVDQHVYIDLNFMQQLEDQLIGTTSDLAEQYIVAHEYGHHVQNLLGTSDKVDQHEQSGQNNAHLYSEGLELQADCYAGVWINSVKARGLLDSDQEVNEAFDAANGVGDDYIESQGGGTVDPDTFTHGTSAQRKQWLNTGYTSGDPRQCAGTFAAVGVSL
jgi:predicted metalloprotease